MLGTSDKTALEREVLRLYIILLNIKIESI